MSLFNLLREQIDLARLVERETKVAKKGRHKLCRCPFHDDSTPSCYIYDDHIHCYGCGWHGDVVDLWQAKRGFSSSIEAALDLAHEYNIPIPDHDPEAQQQAQARREKETTFAQQVKTYHQSLDARSIEWWVGRGFAPELQQRFLLGANATAAVIPFWHRGRVCGLIRRQFSGEPKYLLSAAQEFPCGYKPLFIIKGATDYYLVVEGFIDALALAALGFSAIAIGGTGISDEQLAELKTIKAKLYLLPDADEPGTQAGRDWVSKLYPKAKLCPTEYGEGRKDVADLFAAQGDTAKAIIEQLIARAQDALDLALAKAPKGSTRDRWHYAKENILPLLRKLEDEGERNAAIDDTAKALGLKATDLRRDLKPQTAIEQAEDNSAELVLHDPELWPESVDGVALLDELTRTVSRFLSAADDTFKIVALWIVYAYAYDLFDVSPLLAIVSPEKRCGKTTLLILLDMLVPRPLAIANITASALFRTVEKFHPTLLIDEADSFLTDNEELRGILNSGHRRGAAYVIRTVGDEHEPKRFTTWTPKAIALIGSLPATLEDRSIMIRLQRKRAHDETERISLVRFGEFEHLRQRCVRWVADVKDVLRLSDPQTPAEIQNDRACDNWRPLLAIADAVGGVWPEQARRIACAMSATEPDSESAKTLLLGDLKAVFAERTATRLTSEAIIQALLELESRPWAEWKSGKPLSKIGLARLLKPFGIEPKKWRDQQLETRRGYYLADFDDTFARYLGIESPQSPHATESTTYSENQVATRGPSVATRNPANSNEMNAVASVATRNPVSEPIITDDESFLPAGGSDEEYERRYNERHLVLVPQGGPQVDADDLPF
jgi:putative DNA primase/helicase